MCTYEVPNIPQLGFMKIDDSYIFHSQQGKIRLHDTDNYFNITNIDISIDDMINVEFLMKPADYKELFLEKDNESYEKPLYSQITYIECEYEKYSIIINKCHEIYSNNNKICLYGSKINLIKNNEKIDDNELVNVWNVLETDELTENTLLKLDNYFSQDVFLKSVNLKNQANMKEIESIMQLLNKNSFLYYKTTYKNIGYDFINNIKKLLYFYDLDENPIRMKVIEGIENQKLEIIIESKFFKNPKLKSIFEASPRNLYDFIHSTYPNYIKLKNTEINIDLLLHYYVLLKNEPYVETKFILFSIFMEILKKDKFYPNEVENEDLFEDKIKNKFLMIKLDTLKIFESLHPEVFNILNHIEDLLNTHNYSKNDISHVNYHFKKNYLISLIAFYRNKSIHSGEFKFTDKKIKDFIDKKWMPKSTKLTNEQCHISKQIKYYLKLKLCQIKWYYDLSQQAQTLEFILEIILLRLLRVDCTLGNLNEFKERMKEEGWINSKDFMKNYLIRFTIKNSKPHNKYIIYSSKKEQLKK